ncbi:MAG: hypothetical protein JOZ81_31780 [Chloroflexi bacterium]|nr:hypothetical protein [Chloroflexota bacterium]
MLVGRVPDQASSVDSEYADYLAKLPDDAAKANGVLVGEQVAAAILTWRTDDGFDNDVPYLQRPPGPGVFEPVLPRLQLMSSCSRFAR